MIVTCDKCGLTYNNILEVGFGKSKVADRMDEITNTEKACEPNGNYGLCKTHPTCELVRRRIKRLIEALKLCYSTSFDFIPVLALLEIEACLEENKTVV